MAKSSTSFTSETARLTANKFWQTSTPNQIEQRNSKIRRLQYRDPNIIAEVDRLYRQDMNTCDIAKRFNVHKNTVLRAMHLCKIPLKEPPARYDPNLTANYHLAYTLGVVYGDGFCYKENRKSVHFIIGLNTVDKEFLECFSFHLSKVLGRARPLRIKLKRISDKLRNPYYHGECSSNKLGEYIKHLNYEELELLMQFPSFRIGFLRGFFDSEGCICLYKNNSKKHPKQLTINAHNTDLPLLNLIKKSLTLEGISTYQIRWIPMPNRWNVKPLYKLEIHNNYCNLSTFITKIGSRIKRKQQNIWQWKRIWVLFLPFRARVERTSIKQLYCIQRE